ncbi:MAG: NUDIX hydrolase [Gemmatimonadetes bacterium]|nr:NUDIX hydrolase [Gemmatimonadota bacterium]
MPRRGRRPRRGARSRAGASPREEVSAGGVVLRREGATASYLVIRDSYKNWGFPKGHLEDGETAEQAALREVREETGLDDLHMLASLGSIDWHFQFRGKHIHKWCHFFLLESFGAPTVPQKEEGITECRWVELSHAIEMIAYDNARDVLRRAADWVEAARG